MTVLNCIGIKSSHIPFTFTTGSLIGTIGVKTLRSFSLTESSFLSLADCLQNATQNNTQRSRSEPIIETNLNVPKGRITVNELTTKLKSIAIRSLQNVHIIFVRSNKQQINLSTETLRVLFYWSCCGLLWRNGLVNS